MKKEIYIHIGTGKTGTTAIQDFMLANENELALNGILYCKSGRTGNNHHLLCQNFGRDNKTIQSDILNNIKLFNKEIELSSCNKFVISSEYFPGLTLSEIQYLCGSLSANVIPVVYLRRQDEYIESWYAQVVKAYHVSYSIYDLIVELYKANILNYDLLIKNWEMYSDNIIVRPYEKQSFFGGNIFDDFLKTLSIERDFKYKFPERKSNLSIYRYQIQLKNSLSPFSNDQEQETLSKPIYIDGFDEKYFMPPEKRKDILNEFSAMNTSIAKKYLGRDTLFTNLDIDSKWNDPTTNSIEYLELFIKEIKNKHPNLYVETQDLFFRFCMIMYDNYQKSDFVEAQKYISIATFMRPNSELIKLKKALNDEEA